MAALSRDNRLLGPGLLLPAALGNATPSTSASRALGEGDAKLKAENGGIGGLLPTSTRRCVLPFRGRLLLKAQGP